MPATGPGVASVRAIVAEHAIHRQAQEPGSPTPGRRPGQSRAWRHSDAQKQARRQRLPDLGRGEPQRARQSRERPGRRLPQRGSAADPAGAPDQAVKRQGQHVAHQQGQQHAAPGTRQRPSRQRPGRGRTTTPVGPDRGAISARPTRRSRCPGRSRAASATTAASARPAAQDELDVGLLGVGADLEQVGDGHVAGGEHGDRQRGRGDRARARGAS